MKGVPMTGLDCVIVGYNDGDFDDYRAMCERAGAQSPEMQIYRKEHLVVDDRPMPLMDVFNTVRNRATGGSGRYHVGEVFNLASLYLANFLRRQGMSAEPISLFSAERQQLVDLLADKPAVVAVTTTFYVNILPVIPVVELIRQHSPESHVVVGGPLVDNLCRAGISEEVGDHLDAMGADTYVLESQGERTLHELCLAVTKGASLDSVGNLIHHAGGAWRLTRREPENNDLDECWIDWSQFSDDQLGATCQTRTARSCAFKCSFCDYPTRAGALTLASIDTIRREMRLLAERGVRNIVFVDDTFNVPPKRFKEFCRMMIEEDLGLNWYSYFRCSNARDTETFDLAARSGCAGVFLGIESGDDDVLANMHKLAQDAQYRSGIRHLKERGVTTFASLIVGFPGESDRSVANTVDFINETAPDFWRAQVWWANPKSPVYRQKDALGIEGRGYTWSHRTMTSEEAAGHCDAMFERVTESVWLPLYDFDFWTLPYLDGKNVGVAELTPLLRTAQRLMSERDHRNASAQTLQKTLRELESQIVALDPVPPKYST
jgi:radical SAM PhpK family P-methyltransferase